MPFASSSSSSSPDQRRRLLLLQESTMSSASSSSSFPDQVDGDGDFLRRLLKTQSDFVQLLPVVLVRNLNDVDDPTQSFATFCPDAARCRQDPVKWILRAQSHYRLSPVTAYRAVNYLDRFLHRRVDGDCDDRLLTVTCLSLAAKMVNDYRFPKVSGLQRLLPGFLLTSPMLRRMELFVGSVLEWPLLSVTPFDFVPIFATTIDVSTSRDLVQTCSDLLLRSIYFPVFLNYGPSEVAAAAVLCASGVNIDFEAALDRIAALLRDRAMGHGMVKGSVKVCYQLMSSYFVPGAKIVRREFKLASEAELKLLSDQKRKLERELDESSLALTKCSQAVKQLQRNLAFEENRSRSYMQDVRELGKTLNERSLDLTSANKRVTELEQKVACQEASRNEEEHARQNKESSRIINFIQRITQLLSLGSMVAHVCDNHLAVAIFCFCLYFTVVILPGWTEKPPISSTELACSIVTMFQLVFSLVTWLADFSGNVVVPEWLGWIGWILAAAELVFFIVDVYRSF